MSFESVRQAAFTLAGYPLRSALGAAAIAVAVGTIVTVVTALDAVKVYAATASARTFGADTFVLAQVAAPGRVSRRVLRDQLARNPPLQRIDLAFLDRHAAGVVAYAPSAQQRAEVASAGATADDAVVTGTTARLARIRNIELASGRFFDAQDDTSAAQVAVIGADVKDTLFPASAAEGRDVRIAGRRFRVIGVQTRLGSGGAGSVDKYVWIPLRAFERAFGAPRSYQVFASRQPDASSADAEDRTRATMRARHRLQPGVADDFDILTPEAARGFVATLTNRVGAAAVPISLMALLAAIIVVTNTILVSVTQRIREIGVRRAVGAGRQRIVQEIVAESLLLAVCGGLAGTVVSWGMLALVAAATSLPVRVAPSTVLTALAAAAVSGVAAAWYPARRAVAADVVDALRAE